MDLNTNDAVMYITKAQISKVMAEENITDYDIYDSISFKGKTPAKKITFIVELLDGTIYSNSTSVDVRIRAISDVNTAKSVLDRYGQEFTLADSIVTIENAFVQQSYETPTVEEQFNEVDSTYLATVSINGTFIIGLDILTMETLTIDGEEINVFDFQYNFNTTTNPQAFSSTNSRTITKNNTGIFSISFVLDSSNTAFLNKVLSIALGTESLNTSFNVSFSIGDQSLEISSDFKLISDVYSQKKGEIPTHTITLGR